MGDDDGIPLWEKFTAATEWARDEDFFRADGGIVLATRWMALCTTVVGLEPMMYSAMTQNHEAYEPLILLAYRFDVEVARPYVMAGVLDGNVIEHCLAHSIDPDMARSLDIL